MCVSDHRFEGWFGDSGDFEKQSSGGMLACPVCASDDVRRIPSANLVARRQQGSDWLSPPVANLDRERYLKAQELSRKLHEFVERNCDDVGTQFSDEARRIHQGDAEERAIRGLATTKQVHDLHEEGIAAVPLPPKPIEKEELN